MGAITTSLGGGLSDTANQTLTLDSGEDVLSEYTVNASSTYVSGGFDSLGNAYTLRPIGITDVTVRVGRSGSNPTSVSIRPTFKTDLSGKTPSRVNSTITLFSTSLGVGEDVSLSTESTYVYPLFTNDSGFYGFRGVGGTSSMEYGAGGNGFIQSIYQLIPSTITTSDSISGSVTQASIPSAPLNVSTSSITDTTANITWTAPVDDGMQNPPAHNYLNISGYRINYRNSGSESWKVLVSNMGYSSNFSENNPFKIVTDLSPSTYYEVQVAALNAVTDAHNPTYGLITAHTGVRSATYSFTTAVSTHDIRVWTGTAFKKGIVKIWDGAAWIQYPNVRAKVWDGTTTTRTNLIENPNFETNTTNWEQYFGYISRVTTTPQAGTYCLQASADGDGDVAVKYYKANAVTLGTSYKVGVYVRISSYNQQVSVAANFGGVGGASTSITATTAWQYVELPAMLPTTGGTEFTLTISASNFDGYLYVDSAILEKTSSYSGYFDGNTPDAGGIDYSWTGTANASTSTATGEALAASLGFKNVTLSS